MEHNILTLDYWQDQVKYVGKLFPAGMIGCQTLNIPEEVVSTLQPWGTQLQSVFLAMQMGHVDIGQLRDAKVNIRNILELLQSYPPFSWTDVDDFEKRCFEFFTEEVVENVTAFVEAQHRLGPAASLNPAYRQSMTCLTIIQVFSQLPSCLSMYQTAMLPFAEILNRGGRTPEDYAEAFAEHFPKEAEISKENPAWMALSNISVQYRTAEIPGRDCLQMVKQMHYMSFYGMFRSDLFEGLSVGHAPKLCPICGRWFLTLDARHTKYCGGLAPNDSKHRTCRQIGNLQGRHQKKMESFKFFPDH